MPAQPTSPEPAPVTDALAAQWQELERRVDILLADRARAQERIVELEAELKAERKVHHSYVRWAPCVPAAQEVRDVT